MVYHSPQNSAKLKACNPLYSEPAVKLLPTYAVYYNKPLSQPFVKNNPVPVLNKHDGTVSDKSATKIRNAINWMLYFTKKKKVYSKKERTTFWFYLNFITLTLPSAQLHDDYYVKDKMLTPFIEWMCRTKGAKMWFWKVETQDNGNIHIHISSHIFLHWKVVRHKWNQICKKHGYEKVYQDGSKGESESSTQVKAAKSPEHVGGYLASYVAKKDNYKKSTTYTKWKEHYYKDFLEMECCSIEDKVVRFLKRPIEGRLWSCSTNLAKVNVSVLRECDTYLYDDINDDMELLDYKVKDDLRFQVLLYRHLKFCELPTSLKVAIDWAAKSFDFKESTTYEVESLFS